MATAFTNKSVTDIGTELVPLYEAPAGMKAVLVGCLLTNKTAGALPLTVIHRSATAGDIHLLRKGKVSGGKSADPAQGKKCVLLPGDQVMAKSAVASAFDAFVSVLEGVA